MYTETIENFAGSAAKKSALARHNPMGYFLASALAGVFVGLGILLIFSVGAPFAKADSPALKLVMGASFGIALSLVIFAGSELFTGNAMVLPFGIAKSTATWGDLGRVWALSWVGNLVGSVLLAWITVSAGSLAHSYDLFAKVSAAKMTAPALELFLRGLLCNTLVCLAIWTSSRTNSDSAKLLLIFWCLFGFIGSGYEHSIANMTLLAMGIFANQGVPNLNIGGYGWNLLWVTLGNIAGALLVMVLPYLIISKQQKKSAAE